MKILKLLIPILLGCIFLTYLFNARIESARAAISVDNTAASGNEVGVTSFSWTHTVNTLNNTVIDISLAQKSSTLRWATSVTVNGSPATAIASSSAAASGEGAEDWYFVATTTGANAIKVTLPAGYATAGDGFSTSLTGINASSPLDAHNCTGVSGTNSGISTQVSASDIGDYIVGAVSVQTGTSFTTNSGQTAQTANTSGGVQDGGYQIATTTGNNTMAWKWTSGTNAAAQCVAAYLPQAGVKGTPARFNVIQGQFIVRSGRVVIQ